MKNKRWGGYLGAAILSFGGVALLLFAYPVAAQGPAVTPTVTPTPDAAALKLAAEQRAREAQNQIDQALRNAADAKAQLDSANQDIVNANTLMLSQKFGAASEAISAANGKIGAALARISDTLQIVTVQSGTIERMSNEAGQKDKRIADLESQNQQLTTDKKTILQNYNAVKAAADDAQSRLYISPYVAVLSAAFLLCLVVYVVILKWQSKHDDPPNPAPPDPPAAPPIDGDWQDVTNDTPPGEQS